MMQLRTKEEFDAFRFPTQRDCNAFAMMRKLARYSDALILGNDSVWWVQSDPAHNAWVWTAPDAADAALAALVQAVDKMRASNQLPGVTARPNVVRLLEAAFMGETTRKMRLTAYVCPNPVPCPAKGQMVAAETCRRIDAARLIAQLAVQSGTPMSDADALEYADTVCNRADAYGYVADGALVSMAQVSARCASIACINLVVTDEAACGHGYARDLVSQIARAEVQNGFLPQLYAETDYPSSNRMYQAIGFLPMGDLIELAFC